MNMIERVARAICSSEGVDPDFNYDPNGVTGWIDLRWKLFVPQARVAIEAMRDPTNAMAVAGAATSSECIEWSLEPGEGMDGFSALPAWQAMIEVALNGSV